MFTLHIILVLLLFVLISTTDGKVAVISNQKVIFFPHSIDPTFILQVPFLEHLIKMDMWLY